MGGSAKNARKNREKVSSSSAGARLIGGCFMLPFKMVRRARLVNPVLACWLFGTAALAVAPKARAWGDEGHRVVGEIAWRYLSSSAQAAVSQRLTEPGYESL